MDIPLEPRTLGEEFALVAQLSLRFGLPLFLLFFALAVPDLLAVLAGEEGSPWWGILTGLAGPLAIGYATARVGGVFGGRSIGVKEALRVAFRAYGSLLVWQILCGAVLTVGLLLLVVPGLMWFSSYALAGPDLVMERNGLGRALNRASNLYRGARVQVTVLISTWVVLLLVPTVVLAVLGADGVTPLEPAWIIVGVAIEALVTVPLNIAPIVAYFSRRCVVEKLDPRELSEMVETIGERRIRSRRAGRRRSES